MDPIKDAFNKVKDDFSYLKEEIYDIKKELEEIQLSILNLIKDNFLSNSIVSTDRHSNKTVRQINTTDNYFKTDSSTDILLFKGLKELNIESSIGNKGVSTDRQTDRQTDKSSQNISYLKKNLINDQFNDTNLSTTNTLINQLDLLKQDFKSKFKKLTNQEMLVFSTIYQYDLLDNKIDYTFLAGKLSLSESSIRDYIQRMILKGIPLVKEKINNKKIILHIPEDLKKLASLDTLISLRES